MPQDKYNTQNHSLMVKEVLIYLERRIRANIWRLILSRKVHKCAKTSGISPGRQ